MKFFLIILASLIFSLSAAKAQIDTFSGSFVFEWINDQSGADRDMVIQEPVSYVDPTGKEWPVPKGARINGASIPPLFYQLIGPPFVGNYRRASVVHDHYCDIKTEGWRATHRMFRDACLAGGVGAKKAQLMFAAVYAAGPRWKLIKKKVDTGINPRGLLEVLDVRKPEIPEGQLESILRAIEETDLTYSEIEARIDLIVQNPFPSQPGDISN